MSYEPLHHKYRPQSLGELVGQEAIASTLTQALTSQKIAPAYLFTGPRGTGKTSSARIFAKSLNCLSTNQPTPHPCGTCLVCEAITRGTALDVIEIDAASNTGVDNIREIIERAQFAPVQCRYKVYVIDECHMLSTAAFNALLKTFRGTASASNFYFGYYDPQRVLPTIISRCQRFDYRRIPLASMVQHLGKIADLEGIDISPEALTLVAQLAHGGLRDAQSLLAQLSLLAGEITPEKVWDLVGATPEQDLGLLLKAITEGEAIAVLQQVRKIIERGREPLVIIQNLANFYLNLLIVKNTASDSHLLTVTPASQELLQAIAPRWTVTDILRAQQQLKASEVQIKNTTQPHLWLEVTLLGLLPQAVETPVAAVQRIPEVKAQPSVAAVQRIPEVKVQPSVGNRAIQKIYTDGSCLGNPGPGGWAYVVYFEDGSVTEAGGKAEQTTNQQMELQAALAALEYLEKIAYNQPVTVYTDSKYVIDGITKWIKGWRKNGWQNSSKQPVANQELWQPLDELNQKFTISWEYVPGHQGEVGNERADTLARTYASSSKKATPEKTVTVSDPPQAAVAVAGEEMAIWQKVLAHLEPPTTRALLEQQGSLLSFDGNSARVGISSEKLLKLHKGKIKNIEAAFQSLLQRPVKVNLEVASVEQIKKPLSSPPPPPPPPEPITIKPPVIKEEPPLEPETKVETLESPKKLEEAASSLAKYFKGEIVEL